MTLGPELLSSISARFIEAGYLTDDLSDVELDIRLTSRLGYLIDEEAEYLRGVGANIQPRRFSLRVVLHQNNLNITIDQYQKSIS
jgi:hypothetical protein